MRLGEERGDGVQRGGGQTESERAHAAVSERSLRVDVPLEGAGRCVWNAHALRVWWALFAMLVLVFSAFPIANYLLGLATKDYGLWYQVGVAVRRGYDIYPRPETKRLFPFMYPPSAAAMLGVVSYLGSFGSMVFLIALNSAAWLVSIWLAVRLAAQGLERPGVWLYLVPSLSVIVLVHNIYLLGQPNLLLLALVLGAFVCLRSGWQAAAGALVATAAAIKAFPIMVLGYFVYRRQWVASASTIVVLAAWLFAAPLLFRTPAQTIDDLVVWSQGMLFTYNTHGIAQRPYRSYSYKNQSIMALAHRLLRDVPADGESVLAAKAKPATGAEDPARDLFGFLKPHAGGVSVASGMADSRLDPRLTGEGGRGPRWDESLPAAAPALKKAWRVNVANLDFRAVTLVTLAAIGLICLFVLWCLPPREQSTGQALPLEYAIVTLMTTIFSPLSFNYAYVWLLYPTTLALALAQDPGASPELRRWRRRWVALVLVIPAAAILAPRLAQAYGNLFIPAMLLLIGMGLELRRLAAGQAGEWAMESAGGRRRLGPRAHVSSAVLVDQVAQGDRG